MSSLREDSNLCRARIQEIFKPVVDRFRATQEQLRGIRQRIAAWRDRGAYFFLYVQGLVRLGLPRLNIPQS